MRSASGQRGDYAWLAAEELPRLIEKLVVHHRDARLCITSFDSGLFTPTSDEVALGWTQVGNIAVSPPLTDDVAIPSAGFDEWYLFDHVPASTFTPEVFVNYVPFPIQQSLSLGASATDLDDADRWLADAQARFWQQIAIARPLSYVARADSDMVVSRNAVFVQDL